MVAIPHVLPMEWREWPPYFSTSTEAAADLANASMAQSAKSEPHRLDDMSETAPAPPPESEESLPTANDEPTPSNEPNQRDHMGSKQCLVPTPIERLVNQQQCMRPTSYWDVYVDSFLGLCQGNHQRRLQVKRHLLNNLDSVFRRLEASDSTHRQEPASVKKMLKGDATWATRKVMLGWIIDTITMTLELPPHRLQRLHNILQIVHPDRKRVALCYWHKFIGELRSMTIAIPGTRGLLSTLQEAFRHIDSNNRVKLSKPVHNFLNDFRWLAADVAARPTRIAEVTPMHPVTRGACDASGEGMGGVHFIPTKDRIVPMLWRAKFPKNVTAPLVSYNNTRGTINNGDLELAGSIAHADVLCQTADVAECTIHNCYDNTAAVHWQCKGSTTT